MPKIVSRDSDVVSERSTVGLSFLPFPSRMRQKTDPIAVGEEGSRTTSLQRWQEQEGELVNGRGGRVPSTLYDNVMDTQIR